MVLAAVVLTDLLSAFGARRAWVEGAPGAAALQRALAAALDNLPPTAEGQYTAIVDALATAAGSSTRVLRGAFASSASLEEVLATAIERPEVLDTVVQSAYRPVGGADSAALRAIYLQVVAESLAELDGVVGSNPLFGSWFDLAGRYDVSTALLAHRWDLPSAAAPLVRVRTPSSTSLESAGAAAAALGVLAVLAARRRRGR